MAIEAVTAARGGAMVAASPRMRFAAALRREALPGLVPHFELVFFLTMEAFGRVHPSHRVYHQWQQMTLRERDLHRRDMADLYLDTARRYGHDAILLHPNPGGLDEQVALIQTVRQRGGGDYFLMLHGDATFAIPDGQGMEHMSLRMLEEPDGVDAEATRRVDDAIARAQALRQRTDLDGFTLCSDYCFNTGPFLPPTWFDRFITPHLHRLTRAYKELGFYVIKHTDGNIMPILDRLVPDEPRDRPHALHSLDPQGGVDIAAVVDRVGDKVALCGNVDCGLLQTGDDEQCIASARHAIRHGLRAPGYIFSTSNCIYTGMDLKRYELILDVHRREAIRP
jgi:uroporphyrinogen decarboxylase